MGRNDDDLTEEEKARRGMAMMGLLDYIRRANENKAAVATIGNAILLIFNIGNFIIISKV